jgi:predicted NUDIX family NTP pyrophosphohydrolase
VLVYRWRDGEPQFLLVHPGGPFWRNRDAAAWSIPKGLADAGEDFAHAAAREFEEELGQAITGDLEALTPCRQPGGKVVHAWLTAADLDLDHLRSNAFELEWPPRSGTLRRFPEVDRASYFPADVAFEKLHRGLRPILLEALERLAARPGR